MTLTPKIGVGLFSYQFGGSERVGVDLALEFKARGYQVICFAFHDSEGPLKAELESAGIKCVEVAYPVAGNVIARRLIYLWKFYRMLRRERITALHVHHHGALILCGLPAALAGVDRVVMTEHGLQALMERASARKLTVRYARYATGITAVEPGQVEYFGKVLGLSPGKLHYVANGIRTLAKSADSVSSMRQLLTIPDHIFAFFYVGRLNQVKDLGTLIHAFSLLPEEVACRSRLYLVGDGPERSLLEAKRDSLRLHDKVLFLGSRRNAAELLIAADAFVMCSKSEGLPMALLEAMAVSVPCIASAVGGIPRLFGSDRGLLVPPEDAEALAKAMAAITTSLELRQRLVKNALENLRDNHSHAPIVDRYLELLGLSAQAQN